MSVLQNESARIEELHELEILDTEPEFIYENIVEMASQICGTPVSLLSFIDSDRQWIKAGKGLKIKEVSRKLSFCSQMIHEDDLMIVEDASLDEKFKNNPFVTSAQGIRFYAGVPVKSSTGRVLGTLCVIDYTPKKLTDSQKSLLRCLGLQASALIDDRKKQINKGNDVTSMARNLCHEINNQLSVVLLSSTSLRRKFENNYNLQLELRRLNQAIDGAHRIGKTITGIKHSCLWDIRSK